MPPFTASINFNKRKALYLAAFALLHAFIFLVIFKNGIYRGFAETDISIPYLYASKMALGQMPYLDFPVEYPPAALLFMLIPRLFSPYAPSYILGFTLEMLFFDLLAMLLICGLAGRLKLPLWKTLAVYTLAILAIGPLIINRFDLIPAVMLLGAVYAFMRGRSNIAWALLAAGTLTKLFPAVAAPLFLLYDLIRGQYRRAIRGIAIFGGTLAVIALPFLIISPGGFLESFTYHTQRGLQIESVLSSVLLLCQKLGLATLTVEHASGGTNVVSPLANALAAVTPVLMVVSLGLVYRLFYRRQKAAKNPPQADDFPQTKRLPEFALLAMLAFILSNKVLSPQFIIWCAPLHPPDNRVFSGACHGCFSSPRGCCLTSYSRWVMPHSKMAISE